MWALIDRYWTHYGMKKRSADREKSILAGIRSELGRSFVREVDGDAVARCMKTSRPSVSYRQEQRTAFQRHAPHDEEGRYDLV